MIQHQEHQAEIPKGLNPDAPNSVIFPSSSSSFRRLPTYSCQISGAPCLYCCHHFRQLTCAIHSYSGSKRANTDPLKEGIGGIWLKPAKCPCWFNFSEPILLSEMQQLIGTTYQSLIHIPKRQHNYYNLTWFDSSPRNPRNLPKFNTYIAHAERKAKNTHTNKNGLAQNQQT